MTALFHTDLSQAQFWDTALETLLTAIQAALKKHGTVHIGLSGGRTPKPLYQRLAEQELPWDKCTFIVLDERCVPKNDPESNQGMLQQLLFSQTLDAKILAFDTQKNPEDAAEEMARELINLSNEREPLFDILILGAGKDGHVASLFEGDSALTASAYAAPAQAKGYPTEKRLTLSLMALQSSATALLLLQGEEKAPVLQALQSKNPTQEAQVPLTALRHLIGKIPFTILTDFKA